MRMGFIKMHRKVIEWEWFQKPNHFHVFTYLLLMAQHKDIKWQGIVIKKGQLLTSRNRIMADTGLTAQNIRTVLHSLKSTNVLTVESTRKHTIITVVHWEQYQQCNGLVTNSQPTANQQLTTCKNVKNVNNKYMSEIDVIIAHYNKTTNRNVSAKTSDTQKKITRILSKNSVQDVIKVIDSKFKEWNNTEFQKYVRPSTLFGNKFETYLEESNFISGHDQSFDYIKKLQEEMNDSGI